MPLFAVTPQTHPVIVDLAYGTIDNFCGKKIYTHPLCFLHVAAKTPFEAAIALALEHNLRLKILDAFRPQSAQEMLWQINPDPMYVASPHVGSNHTRGIAIDLTLVNDQGQELDMGTPFDSFNDASHHGYQGLSAEASKNRYLLLGIMMSAGWDLYLNEWWHYQLFFPKDYPLITSDYQMMTALPEHY